MRTVSRLAIIAVLALVAQTPARAQESFKRAEAFLEKMQDTADELKSVSDHLNKTMTSLRALASARGDNLKDAFGDFDKAISNLDAKTQDVRKRATEMRAKGKDYFVAWQKEAAAIQNPDLRKASESRRTALMTAHDGLTKTMTEGRGLLVTLMGDLQDLRNFVGSDLTESAIASAQGLFGTAQDHAKQVETAIAGVQKQLAAILSRK
ncbi:MAG TPA: DUF2959 family protein [Vicinamibacterales bacterium]|nr:DUF2959 family protein [Vicinamibacterales bacterium]